MSFDRAAEVAQGGDTIVVAGGNYPITSPSEGATYIDQHGTKSPIAFVCKGDGDVTFAAPVFAFHPDLSGVSFTGGCFRFHLAYFGYGGDARLTHDITLDGVHMDSFHCAGCANVTIQNSEVGPLTACGGRTDPDVKFRCDPSNPTEAYWATLPTGSDCCQNEPFVHDSVGATARNFKLLNDHIHGQQTRNSSRSHTGGFMTWNSDGTQLIGNTWDHNAIYDVLMQGNSVDNNVTITDNIFGPPVYPLDGNPTDGLETPKDFHEVTFGAFMSYGVDTNVLIQRNTFSHGLVMGNGGQSSYQNARVADNQLGIYSECGGAGVVYSANTSCGLTAQ